MPSPREILHNRTETRPGKPSTPVDMEAVRDYLITKKISQKQYHDKTHNVKPLPDLSQGQEVLFLSPADPNQYIEGTVLAKSTTTKKLPTGISRKNIPPHSTTHTFTIKYSHSNTISA